MTACSPSRGNYREVDKARPTDTQPFKIIDYKKVSYFTIALTAASPSTATTTTPAGAAIVASEEVTTVLAIV